MTVGWALLGFGVGAVFIVLAEPARRFGYALAALLETKTRIDLSDGGKPE